jgi:dipeptidyl aminopeptidase/acylaminoacyl peptidase
MVALSAKEMDTRDAPISIDGNGRGNLMTRHTIIAIATALLCATAGASAQTQRLEDFARRPQMHGLSISADGRYVAFLSGAEDDTLLMTLDRTQQGSTFKRVTTSEPDKFDIGWCRFASTKRLLCGLYGNLRGKKYAEPPFTRMFAVDADGAALRALEQSPNEANLLVATTSMRNLNMNQGAHIEKSSASSQGRWDGNPMLNNSGSDSFKSSYSPERQDQVIDFTPGDDDTVLIQMDDDRDTYTSIFQLNINNGNTGERMGEHPPIQSYVTDGRGNPRLGWGSADGVNTQYFARLEGDSEWRRLGATQLFTEANRLRPIAMAWASNTAYAVGNYEGRDALWSIDLADKREPKLLFNHKLVDVGDPILRTDRSLLGVRYDVERPYVWYADPKLRDVIDRLDRLFPRRVHDIVDSSEDMKTLIVQSSADTDPGTYYLYDMDTARLQKLGSGYPELDQRALGTMTNILYKATDGTEIPGYLTVPTGAEAKNLPLIVMPHDGPVARDSWQFSFLRTFLANRGYAVLQMNYRGSSGFGQKWWLDAHQDWGGLTYADIHDGTRWAVQEGIADPKRICIMGWGFGGYAALLAAARNGDTYQCAVSIGGITDLEMQRENAVTGSKELRRHQIGNDAAKIKRDSPLQNVAQISIPVLLVHGSKDWRVQEDHSKAMAKALERNKKPHELVLIKGANHELERKSDRVTLLKEVEDFLAQNLGAARAD